MISFFYRKNYIFRSLLALAHAPTKIRLLNSSKIFDISIWNHCMTTKNCKNGKFWVYMECFSCIPLDAKPFSRISAKGLFQMCLPWRISVKRHSTWPNVKLHTRFLTLWGVNCNAKLHTRVLTLWVVNLQCKITHTCLDFVGCKFTM